MRCLIEKTSTPEASALLCNWTRLSCDIEVNREYRGTNTGSADPCCPRRRRVTENSRQLAMGTRSRAPIAFWTCNWLAGKHCSVCSNPSARRMGGKVLMHLQGGAGRLSATIALHTSGSSGYLKGVLRVGSNQISRVQLSQAGTCLGSNEALRGLTTNKSGN